MNPLYPVKALLGVRHVDLTMDTPKGPLTIRNVPEKYLAGMLEDAQQKGYSIRIERMR